jgi:PAS domain S-box-containing protein
MPKTIAAAYAVVGFAWVLFTDRILDRLVSDPGLYTRLQTSKGWLFVLLSTVLVYFLARMTLHKRDADERELRETVRQLREAHHAFDEKQREYERLFTANPQPMWIYDPETLHFLAVNDAAVTSYGYPRDEWLTMKITDIRPAEDIPELLANIRSGKHQPFSAAETWTHRKHDGSLVQAEISAHSIQFGGHAARVVTAVDVTEQVQLRHALEASEERYRALIEQSVVGTYVVEDEVFRYANPRMEEIFGYQPGEMVGKHVVEIAAPGDQQLVAERILGRLAGEKTSARHQFRGVRKDGSRLVVEIHGTLAQISGRRQIIGVANDVTEQSEAEARERAHLLRTEEAMRGTIIVVDRMVELRDPYTAGHERRVAEIAEAIALEMRLDAARVEGLRLGAAIHDIGKLAIPTDILSKPTRLTPIEYEYVQYHATAGYELLKGVSFPWPLAEMVYQHHERMDGSGYPRGLKGDDILLEARILAVADVVEAMSSHRPYRPSQGLGTALEEIERNAGVLYDERVAQVLLTLVREKGYRLPEIQNG